MAEGIRWRLRHDLAQLLIGVALFDNMGPATRRSREHLPPSRIRPIPVSLVKAAINAVGYEVLAPVELTPPRWVREVTAVVLSRPS